MAFTLHYGEHLPQCTHHIFNHEERFMVRATLRTVYLGVRMRILRRQRPPWKLLQPCSLPLPSPPPPSLFYKRKMILKWLECLLLLLLAGPARHVSAVLSCDGDGWLWDDTRACQKEDLNAVFGARVDGCNIYGWVSGGIKRVHRVPPPFSPLRTRLLLHLTFKIKWWDFGACAALP